MIYVGIDDTDIVGSPGTNQLARRIVSRLGHAAKGAIVCRHQLFLDPRVPYTSQNGSASIQLPQGGEVSLDELILVVRHEILAFSVEGSDPGLAVSTGASGDLLAFGGRAKAEVVTKRDARAVADLSSTYLQGLGGTDQGVIGAIAAVGLAAGGDDGRVVHLEGWPWPDPFSGVQSVGAIRDRGVADIRTLAGDAFAGAQVDVGKHLRPNWRRSRVVLFVEACADPTAPCRAVKLD
jgi:hypothetical protein